MKTFSCAEGFDHAISTLRTSGVVLAPTETVYGLLCDFDDSIATEKIYELKKRPKSKLLAAFMPSISHVSSYVTEIPEKALILAAKFCPGPITIVIPDGKGSTFGFRIPDHPFILELLKRYDRPLGSTSANLSGEPAALSVEDALKSLAGSPETVIDGGKIADESLPSTVVMIDEEGTLKILREGPLSEAEILDALRYP